MEYFDYDSAVESLQGTLTTIKDNLLYYLDFTNENVKSFGPILFVNAGADSVSDTSTGDSGGGDSESTMEC
jgi:hypothetical protein